MHSTVISTLPENYMDEATVVPSRPTISLLIEESSASGRNILKGALSYIRKHTNWRLYVPEHQWGSCVPDSACQYPGFGVITQVEDPAMAKSVRSWRVPVVDVGSTHLLADIPWVSNDNQETARNAYEHLVGLGFRYLAFFGKEGCNLSIALRNSFSNFVGDADRSCYFFENHENLSWEDEYLAINHWLQTAPRPLGVMAANGHEGRKLLGACRAAGIKVPGEVAVLSACENSLLCELSDPPLSSVVPNSRRIGYEAAQCLDRLLSGERDVPLTTLVRPKSVVARKSTDYLAVDDPDVAAAAQFIRENALKGIKVADVLEAIPMSRRVLESKFRNYLGRTPHQEILNVRLENVKSLLQETDLSLERIAARCGFRYVEYMTVVFKRELGLTPSAYRRQFR